MRERGQEISIHSPYTGRDHVNPSDKPPYKIFQSTLPIQGETIEEVLVMTLVEHFNPLSLYRERRECLTQPTARMESFQSTLPIQGETMSDLKEEILCIFQSTLPIQGETAILHIKPLIYSQSLMQNAKQKNFFQHLHNKL